ncbi:toxin Doc [Streptomyces pratensis]|uniref:toxin Doc n=1 Tax=Streptomyces pratensis TaxID=1169025 RepID=UPI003627093E
MVRSPDYRRLLERQANLLDDLAVNDCSVFAGLAARHKIDPPRHDQHSPDAFWRAAVRLEECVVMRPLPACDERYGVGVAVAYLGMHGEQVNTKFEAWRELMADIRGLQLDSYDSAERLRSFRAE